MKTLTKIMTSLLITTVVGCGAIDKANHTTEDQRSENNAELLNGNQSVSFKLSAPQDLGWAEEPIRIDPPNNPGYEPIYLECFAYADDGDTVDAVSSNAEHLSPPEPGYRYLSVTVANLNGEAFGMSLPYDCAGEARLNINGLRSGTTYQITADLTGGITYKGISEWFTAGEQKHLKILMKRFEDGNLVGVAVDLIFEQVDPENPSTIICHFRSPIHEGCTAQRIDTEDRWADLMCEMGWDLDYCKIRVEQAGVYLVTDNCSGEQVKVDTRGQGEIIDVNLHGCNALPPPPKPTPLPMPVEGGEDSSEMPADAVAPSDLDQ